MSLTTLDSWKALEVHHRELAGVHMRQLFADDPGRFEAFSLRLDSLLLDYSKNRITGKTMRLLLDLAREREVSGWTAKLFSGEKINQTEQRAVLHTALRNRSNRPVLVDGEDVMPAVNTVLGRMRAFTDDLREGDWKGYAGNRITDVVSLGIGGSDLGPRMVTEALTPYHDGPAVHFVSNVDGSDLSDTLERLSPESTLFIVVSKTFTTQETMANAQAARDWVVRAAGDESAIARHFVAVSVNSAAVRSFGIDTDNMFEFWDWVGGRYSLWSAVGLGIAAAVGMDRFEELLSGAHRMDEHFRKAPLEENMPVILAMLGIWYCNFFGADTCAILPYSQHLQFLPAYLQQTDMESNGKRVTREGVPVEYPTAPVIWGESGTNAQHSFFQLLHQGTHLIPADFLAGIEVQHALHGHQQILLANVLAQSEALMKGRDEAEATAAMEVEGLSKDTLERLLAHRVFPGNMPSNTLLYRKLTPATLGMLLALYEHKVFVQGVVWGVNSYDQWGVELGKQLAGEILRDLEENRVADGHDSSTNGLLAYCREVADPE